MDPVEENYQMYIREAIADDSEQLDFFSEPRPTASATYLFWKIKVRS